MADSWPYSDLGEPVDPNNSIIIKAKAGSGGVTKGQVVKLSAAATLDGPTVVAATAGAVALGVAISGGAAGEYVGVLLYGPVKVTGGGSISAGAKVDPNDGGEVVAHSTGTIIGTALTAASADGDTLLVWVNGV
ncbi:MAG: DUF2190 family protein [Candidatus Aenigmatarchaeota archaeon]